MPIWSLFQPVLLSDTLRHHPNHRDPLNCGSQPYNVSPLVGHIIAPKGHDGHVEQCARALGHGSRHVGHQSDDAQTARTWPSHSFWPCNVSPLVGHVTAPVGCTGHAKRCVHALRHAPTTQHGMLRDRCGPSRLAMGPVAIQASGLIVAMQQQCAASRRVTTAAACINHTRRCAHLLGHVT